MSPASRPTRLQWGLLALIVAAGSIVRFVHLDDNEAHFDELWHLELSTGRGSIHGSLPKDRFIPLAPAATSLAGAPPWYAVWSHLDFVTHPPLYPLILRAWRSICGESIPAARVMSAVLSILCVPLLFAVVWRQGGPVPALWAALIMALSSAQVDHAQEVRNYPLATVICLLAASELVGIESSGASRWRLSMLALTIFLALLTHYFVAPVVVALAIHASIRRRASALVAIVAGCLLFAIAWGPGLMRQIPTFALVGSDPRGLVDAAPGAAWRTLTRVFEIPLRQLFEPRQSMRLVGAAGAVLFIIPWLLVRRSPALLLWALWLTCVVGFALLIDLSRSTRHLEQLRHTVLASPAVCAIIACALVGARPIISSGFPAVVALACLLSLPLTYTRQNPRFSEVGRALSGPATGSDPVVFYSDEITPFAADFLYLGACQYSHTFPRPAAIIHSPADQALIERLHASDNIWLVCADTWQDSARLIPGTREVSRFSDPHLGFVARLKWVDRLPSVP